MVLPINQVKPVRPMLVTAVTPDIPLGGAARIVNDDEVQIAVATSLATASFWGIALQAAGNGLISLFQFDGGPILIPAALQNGSAWAANDKIYLSDAVAAEYTNTPPTTVGRFIVPIGRVVAMVSGDALVTIEKGEIVEIT
jgi:hypothetical protein